VSFDQSNGAIAKLLDLHGRLLEVAGESPFRRRAYTRVAEEIRLLREPLVEIAAAGRLREIPGVGEGLAAIIGEMLESGSFKAHEELKAQIPESILELTTIPGVGIKTASRLYESLGVDSIVALEAALVAGGIRETKGLGPRTETTIRSGLESLRRRTGRTPLGSARPAALAFLEVISDLDVVDRVSLAGSARRWESTVEDLDYVVACSDNAAVAAQIAMLPMVSGVVATQPSAMRVELAAGIQADIYFTDLVNWGSTLVRATGNAAHLAKLGDVSPAASEEEVYAAHDLPWIPPELRAGTEEFARSAEIPALVELADINGEFHCHTTWSDGSATVREMAVAAARRGYVFLGITDHSHGLGIAGGLDEARLAAQRLEIAEYDGTDGVKLLPGSEIEVHRDGTLDFSGEITSSLGVIVASLHSGLRQPREELTARLVSVLHDPNVDIIAHPSGRLIERREGGDFDWPAVFATAAQTGTALEINADPARLDLDPERARAAAEAGCLITINSDAHSPAGFAVMEFGVMVARKAWLRPEQILNCWPRERVLTWLADRDRAF
jgi:DNA polymerase (family 10)